MGLPSLAVLCPALDMGLVDGTKLENKHALCPRGLLSSSCA